MENADTHDAPRPPGDAGQASSTTPGGPQHEPEHMLDGLFDGHDSSKEAILAFITTGRAPKDGVTPLRDLFVALSALPTPDDEKGHDCDDTSSSSSSKNNNTKNNSNTDNKGDKDSKDSKDNRDLEHNEHNLLPSIPLPHPLSPTTTPQLEAALPPTPKPDEHTAQDLYDGLGEEPDLRAFFISLLASGKVAPKKVKQLFDISPLAAGEDFTALMEYGRAYAGPWGQQPHFAMQASFGGAFQGMQQLPHAHAPSLQNPQGRPQPLQQQQQHHQPVPPAPQPQTPFHQPLHFAPHGLQHTSSTFEPALLAFDAAPYHPPSLDHGLDQQQAVLNPYIAPNALAHQPALPPADGAPPVASVVPGPTGHDPAAAASFERQSGLPSPVVTQASSNKSDGSATPTGNTNGASSAEPFEVICPLHTSDGVVCGKRCQGAKPYRSIQEHIRRAHPGRYLPGLPATEESFHAMVDSEGIVCPINKVDGSECGHRCTGSKPYRSMQDHIKEHHADRFVPGLPANEASFRIMVEKSACVVCPLEIADGALCNKRCFGEKRYRSIQEHIRRAHPEHYLPGLHANEESFKKMTSGVAGAAPPAPTPSGAKGIVALAPGNDFRPSSQGDVALPVSSSPITRSEENSRVAAIGVNASQPFTSQVWHPPTQETVGTVAPALLTISDIQQTCYPQPLSPYFAYSFQQQALQTFAHAYLQQQPQSLTGLPLGAACLQDPDPTLTRDLFNPQPQLQPMHQDPRAFSALFENARAAVHPHTLPLELRYEPDHLGQKANPDATAAFAPQPSIDTQCPKSSSEKRKLDGPHGPQGDGKGRSAKKPSIRQGNEEFLTGQSGSQPLETNGSHVSQPGSSVPATKKTASRAKANQNGTSSPFFAATHSQNGEATVANVGPSSGPKTSTRPPRNTVSALPVPPLSADKFGLVQEDLAHDPFRLLVATVFLTRTPGKAAMPVFHEVMQRWQTPAELAAADPDVVKSLIHKLGLAERRCETIQKVADIWTRQPPTKDTRYGVKDYPLKGDGKDVRSGEMFGPEDQQGDAVIFAPSQENDYGETAVKTKARGHGTAWEIGHITLGPYAIDSWRIFCRDVLLGRAEDWKGKGREPTFQPEWMRVHPTDKELRACLRWMWMKEGWWWDPRTGEKQVLSEKMRIAVNEGRVDYDNDGNLCITAARDDAVDEGMMGPMAGTATGFGAGFASG